MFYVQAINQTSDGIVKDELLTLNEARKKFKKPNLTAATFQVRPESTIGNFRLVEVNKNKTFMNFGVRLLQHDVKLQYFKGYWWKG